jgi:hypothetical protein
MHFKAQKTKKIIYIPCLKKIKFCKRDSYNDINDLRYKNILKYFLVTKNEI